MNLNKDMKKKEMEETIIEQEEKYLRLYAEFENYKKRVQKEKDDIRQSVKAESISTILDLDNDLSIAVSKLGKKIDGLDMVISKVDRYLESQGIQPIQTEKYDPEIHEVVSLIETGKEGIQDVVSKGYLLNGKVIRYPKVILSK